jgi:hypothetical protein
MYKSTKEAWQFWGTLVAAILAVFVIVFIAARFMCFATWRDSGMAVRWTPLAGCQVMRNNGTWVPTDVYREVH